MKFRTDHFFMYGTVASVMMIADAAGNAAPMGMDDFIAALGLGLFMGLICAFIPSRSEWKKNKAEPPQQP